MLVGSGAPNATTTPLSIRAARESRRARYSSGEMFCAGELATRESSNRPEQTGIRMEDAPKKVGVSFLFRISGPLPAGALSLGWSVQLYPATGLPGHPSHTP